ncbi:MAG: MarR family transcriptional regulator [Bacteroidales bacterium]|nr:MarR family transcriptional regulator [Bacteroidales bacterium]
MDEFNVDKEVVFGVISGRVSTAINRRLYRDFRTSELAITPEQWTILLFLSFRDGITQQELANITFKDRPSITRLLDNMEKRSLIARLADKTDKRSNLIYITKIGSAIHQKANEIALKTMKVALNGITEEEVKIGEQILKKIFKNLE